jgi:hypothetical protein
MSRSGYSEDFGCDDPLALGRYRGAVGSAFRGRRGQSFLKDLLKALEEMPEKRLVAGNLQTNEGEVCALGAIARARNVEMMEVDEDDADYSTCVMAERLNIAESMAREIVFMNDEVLGNSPEDRYQRVLSWIRLKINDPR